jgi:hypothetical protein
MRGKCNDSKEEEILCVLKLPKTILFAATCVCRQEAKENYFMTLSDNSPT